MQLRRVSSRNWNLVVRHSLKVNMLKLPSLQSPTMFTIVLWEGLLAGCCLVHHSTKAHAIGEHILNAVAKSVMEQRETDTEKYMRKCRDCMNAHDAIYPYHQIALEGDRSSGHMKGKEDGLKTEGMNCNWLERQATSDTQLCPYCWLRRACKTERPDETIIMIPGFIGKTSQRNQANIMGTRNVESWDGAIKNSSRDQEANATTFRTPV